MKLVGIILGVLILVIAILAIAAFATGALIYLGLALLDFKLAYMQCVGLGLLLTVAGSAFRSINYNKK